MRLAERQAQAVAFHPPPCPTRTEFVLAPRGSTVSHGASSYQFRHHSMTFPCMSHIPHAFGWKLPTFAVPLSTPLVVLPVGYPPGWFPIYRPTSVIRSFAVSILMPYPEFNAVVLPARQAYSHCASVGKSNACPVFMRSRPKNEFVSTLRSAGQFVPAMVPRMSE